MEYDHICENCGKDCDELYTSQGFCMTFFVTWVCSNCYKELTGNDFEEKIKLEE